MTVSKVVADTSRPMVLYESGVRARWVCAAGRHRRIGPHRRCGTAPSACNMGLASYHDRRKHRRAAWSYVDACPRSRLCATLCPSNQDKVEVCLDGARLRLEPGQTVVPHGVDRGLILTDRVTAPIADRGRGRHGVMTEATWRRHRGRRRSGGDGRWPTGAAQRINGRGRRKGVGRWGVLVLGVCAEQGDAAPGAGVKLDVRRLDGARQAVAGPVAAGGVFAVWTTTSATGDDIKRATPGSRDRCGLGSRGHGRLAGPRRVVVSTADGETVVLVARHAVAISTGSAAVVPDLPGSARRTRDHRQSPPTPASCARPAGDRRVAGRRRKWRPAWQGSRSAVTLLVRSTICPVNGAVGRRGRSSVGCATPASRYGSV